MNKAYSNISSSHVATLGNMIEGNESSLHSLGQANKSARWMPWH